MNCQVCGAPFAVGVRFCSRCGAAVMPPEEAGGTVAAATGSGAGVPGYAYAGPAMAMRPPRVSQHVRTLGILWVVLGVWRVLGGLFGMFFLSAMTTHRWGSWGIPFGHWGNGWPPQWMSFLVPLIAAGTIVAAGLAFATAYGLLNRTRWGRVVAMIAAILTLLKFPVGTALGIYTLWVLAPASSAAEYDHLATATGR